MNTTVLETLIAMGVVTINRVTGALEANGIRIAGTLTKTWVQFIALAASDYTNYYILITDVHSSTLGDGGLLVRGSATGWVMGDSFLTCTWANIPTAAAKYKGWRVIITDYNNITLICTGTAWVKYGAAPQLVSSGLFGTLAAPTVITNTGITAATRMNVGTDFVLPANLPVSGSQFRLETLWHRVGANAVLNVLAYLGTDGSTGTNNSIVINSQLAATTLIDLTNSTLIAFTGTTSFLTSTSSIRGGNGVAGAYADRTTLVDTTAAMTLSFWSSAKNTNDTVALQAYQLWWEK